MPNRIIFAGGRLDSLVEVQAGGGESTAANRDATYADACISYATQTTSSHRATFRDESMNVLNLTAGTIWVHVEVAVTTSYTVGKNMIELHDSSNQPWIAVRSVSSSTLGLFYNSGTGAVPVWTQLDASWAHPSGNLVPYDIQFTFGSPHTVTIYYNGTMQATGSFTQASLTNIQSFLTRGIATTTGANYWTRFSQYLATEGMSSIGAKVKYCRPTGAGSSSEWTGAATDVNEAVNSDATLNSAATADLTQLYAMTDVTVPTGYVIKSVWNWMRAKNDGVSPLNLKSMLRSSATNYASANLIGMSVGLTPVGMRYDTDPATGVAWTQEGWNSAEAGFQSAA